MMNVRMWWLLNDQDISTMNLSTAEAVPILYRSKEFIVVNKPYDVVINSDNPTDVTLSTLLRRFYPAYFDEKLGHGFRYQTLLSWLWIELFYYIKSTTIPHKEILD